MKHKIAVFRALYLGDMLLAVPALRALRLHFPDSEITLIGLPWAASFVERYASYLDRFVAFAGYPGLPEVEVDPQRCRAFLEEQRAYGYDLALQMHGSGLVSNAFLSELQAGISIGYVPAEQESAATPLTMSMPYPLECHEIYRNLGLVHLLTCERPDARLEFPLSNQDFDEIRALLRELPQTGVPWVGMHVGAKYPSRRWSPARFAEVADRLVRAFDACVLLTGSAQERSTVQAVIEHMQTRAFNLAGQTSLGGLAALISVLDLFISNDTGPVHLAYALDTPSITLFGPTDYQRWRPLEPQRHSTLRTSVICSPCAYQVCPIDHRCLALITPEQVYARAASVLQAPGQRYVPAIARRPDGSALAL